MPGILSSGGWQDLSGDSLDGVNTNHGYRVTVMDPLKAVCTLPGRCQVNELITRYTVVTYRRRRTA